MKKTDKNSFQSPLANRKKSFDKYCESNSIKKIAVTYDSFPKLTSWISDLSEYRVLVDEYHLLLQNIGFREDAINELFNVINKWLLNVKI